MDTTDFYTAFKSFIEANRSKYGKIKDIFLMRRHGEYVRIEFSYDTDKSLSFLNVQCDKDNTLVIFDYFCPFLAYGRKYVDVNFDGISDYYSLVYKLYKENTEHVYTLEEYFIIDGWSSFPGFELLLRQDRADIKIADKDILKIFNIYIANIRPIEEDFEKLADALVKIYRDFPKIYQGLKKQAFLASFDIVKKELL